MKRFFSYFLIGLTFLSLLLTLTSCSKKNSISPGTEITENHFASYTIERIARESFITPENPTSKLNYFQAPDENQVYIDITATVKNLTVKAAPISDLLSVEFTVNDKEYTAKCSAQNPSETFFTDGELFILDSGKSSRVHYFALVPASDIEKGVKVKTTSNRNSHSAFFSFDEIEKNEFKPVFMGDTVMKDRKVSIRVNYLNFADSVEPSNKTSDSSVYSITEEEENTFAVIGVSVFNGLESKICFDDITAICVKDNSGKRYFCSPVVEHSDGSVFIDASSSFLDSEKSYSLRYITKIPLSIKDSIKSIEIFAGNNRYIINI